MKARPDCIACMFKQALNTIRILTDNTEPQTQVMRSLAHRVADTLSLNKTPAALSQPVYEIITEITGVADPYENIKTETNRLALSLLPDLTNRVHNATDPLDAALHVAAAGNIIDMGIGHEFDMEKDIIRIMDQPFTINAIEDFRTELRVNKNVLYLGDNAGEIVFDTILVEHIIKTGASVTFVVKSGPIINDATIIDAEISGMTKLVPVIETGSNDIGINWNNVSPEFRQAFETADIIIGKGHGNFETCNERSENIYFLLKAKCDMVAQALGVQFGDIVFKHSAGQNSKTSNPHIS